MRDADGADLRLWTGTTGPKGRPRKPDLPPGLRGALKQTWVRANRVPRPPGGRRMRPGGSGGRGVVCASPMLRLLSADPARSPRSPRATHEELVATLTPRRPATAQAPPPRPRSPPRPQTSPGMLRRIEARSKQRFAATAEAAIRAVVQSSPPPEDETAEEEEAEEETAEEEAEEEGEAEEEPDLVLCRQQAADLFDQYASFVRSVGERRLARGAAARVLEGLFPGAPRAAALRWFRALNAPGAPGATLADLQASAAALRFGSPADKVGVVWRLHSLTPAGELDVPALIAELTPQTGRAEDIHLLRHVASAHGPALTQDAVRRLALERPYLWHVLAFGFPVDLRGDERLPNKVTWPRLQSLWRWMLLSERSRHGVLDRNLVRRASVAVGFAHELRLRPARSAVDHALLRRICALFREPEDPRGVLSFVRLVETLRRIMFGPRQPRTTLYFSLFCDSRGRLPLQRLRGIVEARAASVGAVGVDVPGLMRLFGAGYLPDTHNVDEATVVQVAADNPWVLELFEELVFAPRG